MYHLASPSAVYTLPCAHMAVLQVIGPGLPNGAAFHALLALSKSAGPFLQWPGKVVGDWLVYFQLGCH